MNTRKGYTDKEIADLEQVMDVLAENVEEFQALMKLRGMTEDQPGYQNFVAQFVRNKLRDEALRNEFVAKLGAA
ncbi:hypothetical protein [Burkholderia cepacia]|uniref:DUF3562 domain-containing protein n=1 Tax=Burkholderia cepacia TaxID=292 RepID=A0AAX2RKR4_BURCE|nr:hypothetical protein [Burkholderia cepacia]TES99635.1 hypothetical protein E3D36_24425 [Burkholderia cepacia]TEU41628.1 hypothetical protein E3D37_26810 [Burkholderia cepacia]TEU48744.1 hypothetical protein E3D38_21325 [Burkholderia cepacia]TEU95369.1 hypothetical protein E3D40_24900 [Burkholderia cepacia]TEV04763.1 hypothetical protein E3D44_26425 [Burkholderia cepacia]